MFPTFGILRLENISPVSQLCKYFELIKERATLFVESLEECLQRNKQTTLGGILPVLFIQPFRFTHKQHALVFSYTVELKAINFNASQPATLTLYHTKRKRQLYKEDSYLQPQFDYIFS